MFAGAFYLFLINGVFIAASTLAVSKLVKLPQVADVDAAVSARHRAYISAGLIAVLVPSVWLGWRFVQQEVFVAGAQELVRTLEAEPRNAIVGQSIDRVERRIAVSAEGDTVLLAIGNAEIRMPYETALQLSTWLRVRGKQAKRTAGDTSRHWSVIGLLDEMKP
jgi:hypothetical protein